MVIPWKYIEILRGDKLLYQGKPYKTVLSEFMLHNPKLILSQFSRNVSSKATCTLLKQLGMPVEQYFEKLLELYTQSFTNVT